MVVSGRPDAVEPVARSIANSPLVKSALHGGDPNFGRILQAAGQVWPPGEPFVADLEIEGHQVVSAGDVVEAAPAELVSGPEIEYVLTMPGEGGETEVFFSDLSPEYVNYNADYTLMRDVATLLEALPYIREFHGQTVVIKYGGAAMVDPELKEEFARDVVLLKYVGMNPVVVHGGGPDITSYMERLGMEVRVRGRPARVRRGHRRGGEDGAGRQAEQGHRAAASTATASRRWASAATTAGCSRVKKRLAGGETDIGFVGDIETVDVDVLLHIAEDYIPVVASVGADTEGRSYNVNADAAAAAVAAALGAFKVVFLTDVEGWRADPERPGQPHLGGHGRRRCASGCPRSSGGMRPKLEAAVHALESGVGNAHILDGRQPHSLLLELFTDEGIGTKLWP